MPPVNVVRPDGSVASVPEESVAALERLGYRREEAAEATRRAGEEATAAYYDTPSQKAIAFGEGALGGATLGLAELALDDQVSREREEHLGGWKLGGEVFGTVATALATGGSGAVGSTARATPAGAALVFGEKAAAKIANPIARAAAANAIEGGISSGALTAAKVLTDNDPDTVESFLGEVGLGTVFGIGAGALGGAGFEALGQVGAKAVQRIERRIGQAAGDDLVKSERGLAAAQEARAHFDDAEKVLSREASLVDEQLALKQQLLEDARKVVDGDGPTYTDLIDEALRRQAAGEPIPNSYIARLGDEMAGEKPPTPHDWLVSGGPVPRNLGRVADEAGVPRPQVKAEGPQVEAKTGAATPKAVKAEAPGGTQATGAGKIAARKAEAAAQPDLPPPLAKGTPGPALKAMDDMEALERETMDLGHQSTRLYFRLKHLREARELLGSPEGLQKLSAAGLADVIQTMKDSAPEAYVGLRGIWERFVDKDLAGMVPDDIASLSQTRAKLWSGLDEKDVPLLAAWTRLQYPGKAFPGGEPVPKPAPPGRVQEGKALHFAHRAFRYLGGRALARAVGGGFAAYALGWSAADSVWIGALAGMLKGSKAVTRARIDRGLAALTKVQNMRPLPGAAIAPLASALSAKDYEDSAREIHALAGAGGREALYAATQNIRFIDPDLADKIVDNGLKKVEYLAKALPKPPPQGLFKSTRWVPSDVDRAKLSGIFRAVEDPPFAVEQMARGRLTPAVAAAFRETSPGLYAKVASALVDFANANPDAPVSVRRQVAVMLGAPADELQMYTAQLQAAFVAEPGDMGPAVTAKAPQNLPTQAQQVTER